MNDKIEEISRLMKEIKRKVQVIAKYNASISEFNFKIEALLTAFEAYATRNEEDTGAHTKSTWNLLETNLCSLKKKSSEKIQEDRTMQNREGFKSTCAKGRESFVEFRRRMEAYLPNNKLFRINAAKIVEYLYTNEGDVTIEDMMKDTGVPRYRCVDILGAMLKADPPLVIKKFDKKFTYSIALL